MNHSRRWRLRAAAFGTTILVAAAIQVIEAPGAHAASCGTMSHYHVGYYQYGSSPFQLEGASASITDAGGYVLCTGDSSGSNNSSSWTMVSANDGNGWAQSGTIYRWGYGSCVKHWAQQNAGGSTVNYYAGGCSAVGDTNSYWQQLVFTSGGWRVQSNMNSTIIAQSSFNPISSWALPFSVSFEGETIYEASNVPGTSSSKQNFTNMQVQLWSDNSWVSTCNNTSLLGARESTRYDFDRPWCNNVRMWTK
jgi:hypothetical protein